MRCKPGDLAVIVRARCPENVGLFVTVLHGEEKKRGWMWECESARPAPAMQLGVRAPFQLLAWSYDSDLRPIRDNPGNEAWFKAAPLSTPSQPRQTAPDTNTNRTPAEV